MITSKSLFLTIGCNSFKNKSFENQNNFWANYEISTRNWTILKNKIDDHSTKYFFTVSISFIFGDRILLSFRLFQADLKWKAFLGRDSLLNHSSVFKIRHSSKCTFRKIELEIKRKKCFCCWKILNSHERVNFRKINVRFQRISLQDSIALSADSMKVFLL